VTPSAPFGARHCGVTLAGNQKEIAMPELDLRTMQTMPQRVRRLSQEQADKVAIRSIEHGDQTWREIFESSLR
jgi:hypothetical protein